MSLFIFTFAKRFIYSQAKHLGVRHHSRSNFPFRDKQHGHPSETSAGSQNTCIIYVTKAPILQWANPIAPATNTRYREKMTAAWQTGVSRLNMNHCQERNIAQRLDGRIGR